MQRPNYISDDPFNFTEVKMALLVDSVGNLQIKTMVSSIWFEPNLQVLHMYINNKKAYRVHIEQFSMRIIDYSHQLLKFQDYDIDMFVVETWRDSRLAHNNSHEYLFNEWEQVKKFWRPDVYLAFSKAARYNDVTVPNMSFKIKKDGSVRYSVRLDNGWDLGPLVGVTR